MIIDYTFDDDCVSDLHKDAIGFRPSKSWWSQWNTNTDAEKQVEWNSLLASLERSNAEKAAFDDKMIAVFETRVANLMHSGTNRARIIAWLIEAENVDNDVEFFEYNNGLPYGYVKKTT